MIELHFAHGYLVNQFLSPLINTRNDRYGGGRDNRMRLALEIYDLCRAVFPPERPIGVRISATDWVEGGWGIEDSIALAKELRARGCDYIVTTSGGVSLKQKIPAGPLYQIPLAEAVRQGSGITTMAVGQITEPAQAETVLSSGKADLIAIGRRLMYDPHWAWRAAQELGVFLKYPARYRNANPRIGQAMDFPESPEKRKRMMDVLREEERVAQAARARASFRLGNVPLCPPTGHRLHQEECPCPKSVTFPASIGTRPKRNRSREDRAMERGPGWWCSQALWCPQVSGRLSADGAGRSPTRRSGRRRLQPRLRHRGEGRHHQLQRQVARGPRGWLPVVCFWRRVNRRGWTKPPARRSSCSTW